MIKTTEKYNREFKGQQQTNQQKWIDGIKCQRIVACRQTADVWAADATHLVCQSVQCQVRHRTFNQN